MVTWSMVAAERMGEGIEMTDVQGREEVKQHLSDWKLGNSEEKGPIMNKPQVSGFNY